MSQEMQEVKINAAEGETKTKDTSSVKQQGEHVAKDAYTLTEQHLESIGRYLSYINHEARHGKKPIELLNKDINHTQNSVLARSCSDDYPAPIATHTFLEKKYQCKQAIRERDAHGRTTLHFLALTGQLERIEEQLSEIERLAPGTNRNALLNQTDQDGLSPLHYLMFSDVSSVALEQFISAQKLDLLATNQWGDQADEIAIKIDNVNAVSAITQLKENMQVSPGQGLVFIKAAREGALLVTDHYITKSLQSPLLINHRDQMPKTDKGECLNQTPLHLAVKYGHFELAEKLIKASANVQAQDDAGNSPLHIACINQPAMAEAAKQSQANKPANHHGDARQDKDKIKGKEELDDKTILSHHPELLKIYTEQGLNMIQLLLKNNADFLQRNLAQQTPQMVCTTTPAKVLLQWKESRRLQKAPGYTHSSIIGFDAFATQKWQGTFAQEGAANIILQAGQALSDTRKAQQSTSLLNETVVAEQVTSPDEAQRIVAWNMVEKTADVLKKLITLYINGQGGLLGGLWASIQPHKELATAFIDELNMLTENVQRHIDLPATLMTPHSSDESQSRLATGGKKRAQSLQDFQTSPNEKYYEMITGERVIIDNDVPHSTKVSLGAIKGIKAKALLTGHNTNGQLMALFSHAQPMIRKCINEESEVRRNRADTGIDTPLFLPVKRQ